jgi:purine-nucleoside/S-methyl-5'-thioadenosine phosphorylase / adenosine deaminase
MTASQSRTHPPVHLWKSKLLAHQPGLAHGVTTRGMNMALTVGNDSQESAHRRRLVCEAMSIPFERLTAGQQTHNANIAVVQTKQAGSGRDLSTPRIPDVDGLVTNEPNTPIMVLGADCCLIVAFDAATRTVGVVHAGWRGTAARAATALVDTMSTAFGSKPSDMMAAIAPCAGVCCYEVRDDVRTAFDTAGHDTADILDHRNGRLYLDLTKANRSQLQASGLHADRIEDSGVCTICSNQYYSFRRERVVDGQFALIAAIV